MTSDIGSFESNLYPLPDILLWRGDYVEEKFLTLSEKVGYFAKNFFSLALHLVFLPYTLAKGAISLFSGKVVKSTVSVLEANRLPPHVGFATSMYQDSGLGTSFSATPLVGKCDWDQWLKMGKIEGDDLNYHRFFFDILRDPQSYIEILKSQNVTAHRFSLEWSVIEPEPRRYDLEAFGLYRKFIQELKKNGIEPYVTLHHFVSPEWFLGFDQLESIETFKNHALKMIELFPEVNYWMPFNEINVDAFQKCVRGVYPPGLEGDIAKAGRWMRNMLIAHCQIYKEAKEQWPEKKIGSTHQWLKFEPLNGNLLEEVICYFLSKITHYACYDFFKTGKFLLQLPGVANVQLSIPDEEFREQNGFSDFVGVQFYGFPRLIAGFTGKEEYPGYGIQHFMGLTFGSTCPKGGVVQSFGPNVYPESLDDCLSEAIELIRPFPSKTIVISETGCDARVWKFGEKDWSVDFGIQRDYFEKILPIIAKFKEHISALFVWTLANGQEWDRGDFPILNVGRMEKGYKPFAAADFLRNLFSSVNNDQFTWPKLSHI